MKLLTYISSLDEKIRIRSSVA